MKPAIAFFKKEWMEYWRTGKLTVLGILFVLFGLMNPAITKLTPFLMEQIASMDTSGISISFSAVDASMSWTQFYKNIPMALIACVLLFSGILTGEIQKGTLIPVLTKGLERWKIFLIKGVDLVILWTMGYWICYGITYFYNDFYWDNHILTNLGFAAFCYWLFGVFIMVLLMLFSALSSSPAGVMLGTGGVYFGIILAGILPEIKRYLPVQLTGSAGLLAGGNCSEYTAAIGITLCCIGAGIVLGCLVFQKREA